MLNSYRYLKMTVKEIFSTYFLMTLGTFELKSSSPGFFLHTMVMLQMPFQPGASLHKNGLLFLIEQLVSKNP